MLFLLPRPDDFLPEFDPRLDFAADLRLFLPLEERPLDFVARFLEPRAEDLEDDFPADFPPLALPLPLLELEDREDFKEARPLLEADFIAVRAPDAARLIVFLVAPPRFPVALAASAPTTPPTTVPTGPTALPTSAPATAPAVSRGMEGISMSSEPPELPGVLESDSLAILHAPVCEVCTALKGTSDKRLAAAVPNCAVAENKKAFAGANAFLKEKR